MQFIDCVFVFFGFVSELRVVVNEWVCLCVGGGGGSVIFRVGGGWRQRDGRDVTSECVTRHMQSERARP